MYKLITIWIVLLAMPLSAKTVTLKLAHNHSRSHPVHQAMELMGQQVKEESKGTLRIRIYPDAVLGSQRETLEQLQTGSLDMVKSSSSEMESFTSEYMLFSYPYLFRNREHLHSVLHGNIGKKILNAGNDKGFRGLTFYESGSRNYYGKKPIKSLEDLKGIKVRVQPSKTVLRMVESMGALPTPIDFGETYTALQQGVVDAAENNLTSYMVSRHSETARYFSWTEHVMVPDVLFVSAKTWQTLSSEQQKLLQQAAMDSSRKMVALWDEAEQKNIARAKKEGVTFVTPDREAFVRAVEPMYAQLQKDNPAMYSWVELIRK